MARESPTDSLIRSEFQYFGIQKKSNMFKVSSSLSLESVLERVLESLGNSLANSLAKSLASREKSLGSDPMLKSHQDCFQDSFQDFFSARDSTS